MNSIIEYLWQLPQNLSGVIWRTLKKNSILSTINNSTASSLGAKVYLMKARGGVTLGKYIFISQTYRNRNKVIKHECGHVKQSKILGPLYLIVIGIPSILHAALNNYIGCCKKYKEGYYHFYTEKWANKLMED